MENQELLDYVLKNDLAKVVRHSFSVTQGEAEVIINGKSIVRYGDERWLQHKDGTFSNGFRTLQANEVDFLKEMIDGWGSILSDEKLIKSALEQFPERVMEALGPIRETKQKEQVGEKTMFAFKNDNGNVYDVLSYDSQNNVALLKLQGNEYNFVVAEGLNKTDWNYGHYFANEEAAHNYFVRIVSDTLDYKVKMKYLLEDEGLNLDGIDFDVLFEKFLNDDSKTGLIDTEYFKDLIEELQNTEPSYEMGTLNVNEYGKIVQDMLEIAKGSENHTWFLEVDEFIDGTYTQEDLNELWKNIQSMKEKGIDDIENIVEMYDNWQEAEEWGDPVATFHSAFLELFEEKQFPTISLPKEKEPNVKQVVMQMENTALLELKNNSNMPYVIASGVNTLDTSKFIEWHSGRYYIDKTMAEQDMIKDIVTNVLANETVSEHELEQIVDKIFDLTTDMDFQDYGTKDEIYEEIQETLTYGTNEQRQEIFNEVYSHMDLSDKEQAFEIMLTLQRMQTYVERADKERELETFNYLEATEMSMESDYGMIDGIINNVDYKEEPKGLDYIKNKGTYSSKDNTQEVPEQSKNNERER